jgi:hypothetical protein
MEKYGYREGKGDFEICKPVFVWKKQVRSNQKKNKDSSCHSKRCQIDNAPSDHYSDIHQPMSNYCVTDEAKHQEREDGSISTIGGRLEDEWHNGVRDRDKQPWDHECEKHIADLDSS